MPWYRKYGKILTPLTDDDFQKGMEHGQFIKEEHRAYPVLLYYSCVRKTEGLRATTENFNITSNSLIFDVGPRLKKLRHKQKGIKLTEDQYTELLKKRKAQLSTPPLPLPIDAPYMDYLVEAIEDTEKGKAVFDYSPKTAYNIVARAFKYPHLFRLSRITNFFLEGWTVPQVRSWTGLSLAALNYYIGIVDIQKMGDSLNKNRE
jgi:hypothetical protein